MFSFISTAVGGMLLLWALYGLMRCILSSRGETLRDPKFPGLWKDKGSRGACRGNVVTKQGNNVPRGTKKP